MKKRILQIFLTAAAVICCTLCAVSASAARPLEDTIPNCKLYDVDNFLSEEEQIEIDRIISETSREIDMYVAVCILNETGSNLSDPDCMRYADDLYDAKFNVPYGKETDGALLLLNMKTHYIWISTCGLGEFFYYNGGSENRIDGMVDHLIDYMRNSDYTGAVGRFCFDLKNYRDLGYPVNAYTYNARTGQYAYVYKDGIAFADKLPWWYGVNWTLWGIIGAIAGSVTALIAAAVVSSSYKLVKTLDASNYISQKETNYYVKDDVFIREHTTKTRINTDSGGRSGGGGGGGSSHSSGGGFSHGGGGGHW